MAEAAAAFATRKCFRPTATLSLSLSAFTFAFGCTLNQRPSSTDSLPAQRKHTYAHTNCAAANFCAEVKVSAHFRRVGALALASAAGSIRYLLFARVAANSSTASRRSLTHFRRMERVPERAPDLHTERPLSLSFSLSSASLTKLQVARVERQSGARYPSEATDCSPPTRSSRRQRRRN